MIRRRPPAGPAAATPAAATPPQATPPQATPTPSPRAPWRLWQQLPLLVGLVLLWMLLWGTASWLSLLSGVLVAVVVSVVFYLPPVELGGRFNPVWALAFIGRFSADLVVASVHVAWLAVRPAGVRGNAVVAAQLATRSDFITTLVATTLSLVPGSIVVEVDRSRSILYCHVIDTGVRDDVDRFRATVRRVERGIVRAVGARRDLEAVR